MRRKPYRTKPRCPSRADRLRRFESLECRWALATFVVNTTSDASDATSPGDGIVDVNLEVDGLQVSLRAAIEEANALEGADTIEFGIPATDQGLVDIDANLGVPGSDSFADQFVIPIRTALPTLDDSTGGTTIDATTQATFGGNINPNGPEIAIRQLDDSSFLTGLVLGSNENRIIGLNVRGFNGDGIHLRGLRNELRANFIGTDGTGTQAAGNTTGVIVFGDDNQIGATTSAQGNLVSGNRDAGIILFGSNNRVEGNRIGVSATEGPLGNQEDGIQISNFANGNRIGSPNSAGNTIAFNGRNGVTVAVNEEGAINNSIRANSIFQNGALGIDLSESTFTTDGVTPNDPGDLDQGANQRQNFPVIDSARFSTQLTIQGSLQSQAQQTFLIDFYVSDEGNPGSDGSPGFGEGQRFLGSTVIQTDTNGNSPFAFTVTCSCEAEDVITATTTDSEGNTSEFSQFRAIEFDVTRSVSGILLEDRTGNGRSNDDSPFTDVQIGVFEDNGDGQFDGGQQDVRVALVDPAADGRYLADDLEPGQYFVTLVDSEGLFITFGPSDATFYSVTLDSEDVESLDFGVFRAGQIAGRVVQDRTGNGLSNDDAPRTGFAIDLARDNGDGLFGASDVIVQTTTSLTPDGTYLFRDLGPGRFFVVPRPVNGEIVTFGGTLNSFVYVVNQTSGELHEALDFGVFQAGQISGRVIRDETGDGTSVDDTPRVGFTIDLARDNGDGQFSVSDEIVQTTTSLAPDGAYLFRDLGPGRFFVVPRPANNEILTFGGELDAFIYEVLQTNGQSHDALDFGAAPLAQVTGRVWIDEDQDGQFDTTETGQANWPVQLRHDNGTLLSVVTNEEGIYTFDNVPPGAYTLTQQSDDRFEPTFPAKRFAAGRFLATGTLAGMAAAADMDGDGLLDALVLNDMTAASGEGTVWYFRNLGQGTFGDAVVTSLGRFIRPRSMVTADVDQDGDLDVVIATLGRPEIGVHGKVMWLQNRGDGQWESGPQVLAEVDALDLALGDLDGNGLVDLAALDFRTDQLHIWLQGESGSFSHLTTITTGRTPRTVAVVDLQQDGVLDLLVGSYDENRVSVLRGSGDGHFAVSQTFEVTGVTDLLPTDLDFDGVSELVASGRDGVQLFVQSNSTWIAATAPRLIEGPAMATAIGDVNGDGRLDVIAAQATLGQVTIAYGLEGTTFGASMVTPLTTPETLPRTVPHSIALADFDGDERADLLAGLYVGGASVQFNRDSEYDVELEFGDEAGPLQFANFPIGSLSSPRAASRSFDPNVLQQVDSDHPLDTSGDGIISPMDALLVINQLSSSGSFLATLDVNQDGFLSPIDALLVINHLNDVSSSDVVAAQPDLSLIASAVAVAPSSRLRFTNRG